MNEPIVIQITPEAVESFLKILGFNEKKTPVAEPTSKTEYVTGLKGIQELFNVSKVTACRLKKTVLRDAVSQIGHVILVDKEKAVQLFNDYKQN